MSKISTPLIVISRERKTPTSSDNKIELDTSSNTNVIVGNIVDAEIFRNDLNQLFEEEAEYDNTHTHQQIIQVHYVDNESTVKKTWF